MSRSLQQGKAGASQIEWILMGRVARVSTGLAACRNRAELAESTRALQRVVEAAPARQRNDKFAYRSVARASPTTGVAAMHPNALTCRLSRIVPTSRRIQVTALDRLKARLFEVDDLQHAADLLRWDQTTYMPPGGAN